MKMTHTRPPLAALFAMLATLLFGGAALSACGSTDAADEETQAAADGAMDGDAMDSDNMDEDAMDDMDSHDMDSHDHSKVLEVPEGMAVPALSVDAAVDPVSGVNLFIELTDFELAPQNASTDPIDGQGHLHLYVDGTRVMRFYNQALHLGGLEPGEREIMVEISSNNHSPYAVDGVAIQQATTIVVPESDTAHGSDHDSGGHDMAHGGELVESATPPTVDVSVTKDPKSGWNVFADVANLTFAAEAAGLDHVDGEGHLHLYVDGEKVSRLYGPWTHIPANSMTAGTHEIMVGVNANTHAEYDNGNGQAVMAMATIEVDESEAADTADADGIAMEDSEDHHSGEDSSEHSDADSGSDSGHSHSHEGSGESLAIAAADADVFVSASFADGSVEVEDRRVTVPTGSSVGISFASDTVEQIHVHGYDLLVNVGPDQAGEIAFLADSPGTFEVELEQSGRFLFEIQVS